MRQKVPVVTKSSINIKRSKGEISLTGSRLDISTVLFYRWFGPRGIASILYTLVIVHEIGSIEGHEEIYAVISLTILLSIILHVIRAQPLVRMYVKKHKEK